MLTVKDIFKAVFVIIGTTIGAGFASGQEINLFFNKYGNMGILGIIISCVITGIIIYKVLNIINKKKIKSYSELLVEINKNEIINKIMKILVQTFLLVSFYVMVAGFAAYFEQEFKIPIYIAATIIAVICYITFLNETKGIVSINTILIPFLTIFICYLGAKNIGFTNEYFQNNINSNYHFGWLFSSILYASYNSILLIPILIELGGYINKKGKAKWSGIICGVVLAILGLIIFFLLLRGSNYIDNLELPMIQITKEFGNTHSIMYGVIILIAIFTTAVASGYGFLKNISKNKKVYKISMIIICATSIFIAPIGFANLVNLLYPIFGVLGLIQIFAIIKTLYS